MLYDAESGNFVLALLGDVMPTRRLSVFREERYLKLKETLAAADATFANLETTVHEYLQGHQGISGGTYMTTEPRLLDELKWLGVSFVSCANNHAFDYGEEGVVATMRYLDAAGIPHAGTGRNLREARSPAYVDTPRGRVALIAATATFSPQSIAGEQRPDVPGRAGLNPLRHSVRYMVDPKSFEELRRIGAGLGFDAARTRRGRQGERSARAEKDNEYEFGRLRFVAGEGFAVPTAIHAGDLQENVRQVEEARRMADWVVVSLHCHDMGGPNLLTAQARSELEELADFSVEFAHRVIDAGADLFIGHGPQMPLGVEIYRDRPIFHSLGSTIFELETPRFLPQEAYARYGLGNDTGPADFADTRYQNDTVGHPSDPANWKQAFATCEFRGKKLSSIDLYPLDLGFGKPRWQRGRPMFADPQLGEEIITRIARLSRKYGTDMSWRDGRGVILL